MSLYRSDFKELPQRPAVGDVITFIEGIDKWGRPCVCRAVISRPANALRPHPLKPIHFSVLLLLILPGLALYRSFGPRSLLYAAVWIGIVSWSTYQLYADDKRRARTQNQREPEKVLHLLESLNR